MIKNTETGYNLTEEKRTWIRQRAEQVIKPEDLEAKYKAGNVIHTEKNTVLWLAMDVVMHCHKCNNEFFSIERTIDVIKIQCVKCRTVWYIDRNDFGDFGHA